MAPMTDQMLADRVVRRRARAAFLLGAVFVSTQAAGLSHAHLNRPAMVQLSAWVVWTAVLLLFLATGGGWLRSKSVRALINDETTDANRRSALIGGFWVGLATAAVIYVVGWYEPVDGRDAVRIVITTMVAAAMIRFGLLEQRSLKDG